MLENAVAWIKSNTVPGKGIVVTSRRRECSPEVTGYFIPTLLAVGERELAVQYARWLLTVQNPDGSFNGGGDPRPYVFDTGQVIRGWVGMLDLMPELERPLRKACNWILDTADRETGRLRGFGFVEMDDEGARAAIQGMDGKDFGGRNLKVNEAEEKSRSGGGGGGGRGGDRRW